MAPIEVMVAPVFDIAATTLLAVRNVTNWLQRTHCRCVAQNDLVKCMLENLYSPTIAVAVVIKLIKKIVKLTIT